MYRLDQTFNVILDRKSIIHDSLFNLVIFMYFECIYAFFWDTEGWVSLGLWPCESTMVQNTGISARSRIYHLSALHLATMNARFFTGK